MKLLIFTFGICLLMGCGSLANIKNYIALPETQAQKQTRLSKECPVSFKAFKESFMSQSEYAFGEIYASLNSSDYSKFVKRLREEKLFGGKVRLKDSVSPNNTVLAYVILDDIERYFSMQKKFVGFIEGEDRTNIDIPIPQNMYECQFKQLSEYQEFLNNYSLVGDLIDDIYGNAYNWEKQDFYRKTGVYIGENNWDGGSTLIPYMVGLPGEPVAKFIYRLDGLKVFQSVPGGILVDAHPGVRLPDNGYHSKIIFVETKQKFTDEYPLNYYSVVLVGQKDYHTVLGGNKTVYAFKMVDTSSYQKILKNYYFYPSFRAFSEIDEKQIDKQLDSILEKKK